MSKKLNSRTEIEEMACQIFRCLTEIPGYPEYLTEKQKQNLEYEEKFEKEFLKQLSYEQRKDYDSLMSIKNSVSVTDYNYALLCGMQLKVAMDEIVNNPLKILRLYDKVGIPASELYKPVKRG